MKRIEQTPDYIHSISFFYRQKSMLARLIGYRNEAMSPEALQRCAASCRLVISAGGSPGEGPMGTAVMVGDATVQPKTGLYTVRITVTSDVAFGRCVVHVDTRKEEHPNGEPSAACRGVDHVSPAQNSSAWYVLTAPLGGEALIELRHDPTVYRILAQHQNDRARVQGLETLARSDAELKMLRGALRENAHMLEELGQVIAANHAVKLELLHCLRSMEVERKRIMGDVAVGRARLEDEWRLEFEKIVFVDYIPKLREIKKKHVERTRGQPRNISRLVKMY